MQSEKTISIAGFDVTQTTFQGLAQNLLQGLKNRNKVTLFFANTNFIVQCRSQLHRMQDDSIIVFNDGGGYRCLADTWCNGCGSNGLIGCAWSRATCSGAARSTSSSS